MNSKNLDLIKEREMKNLADNRKSKKQIDKYGYLYVA